VNGVLAEIPWSAKTSCSVDEFSFILLNKCWELIIYADFAGMSFVRMISIYADFAGMSFVRMISIYADFAGMSFVRMISMNC
jgi:hypothetical protein